MHQRLLSIFTGLVPGQIKKIYCILVCIYTSGAYISILNAQSNYSAFSVYGTLNIFYDVLDLRNWLDKSLSRKCFVSVYSYSKFGRYFQKMSKKRGYITLLICGIIRFMQQFMQPNCCLYRVCAVYEHF